MRRRLHAMVQLVIMRRHATMRLRTTAEVIALRVTTVITIAGK